MDLLRGIRARWLHIKSIGKPWWILVVGAWGAFWTADAVIAKYGNQQVKDTWDKYTLHFPLDWKIGVIGLLAILVLLLVEGSFRNHRQTMADHITALGSLQGELNSATAHGVKGSTTLDRDWPGDWRLMEDGFRRHLACSVRASWQRNAYGESETWTIHGDQPNITREVRAFCKQSGKLLMVSPMSEQLSPEIRSQQDDENRWLYFLKETHGLKYLGTGSENIDGKTYAVSAGEIYMLAAVSASACVECAALSFGN
jgi:hypothetical protein